jgi:hypothetical protein
MESSVGNQTESGQGEMDSAARDPAQSRLGLAKVLLSIVEMPLLLREVSVQSVLEIGGFDGTCPIGLTAVKRIIVKSGMFPAFFLIKRRRG